MIGPGKYDEVAELAMKAAKATGGVALIVIGGEFGNGFSVIGSLPVILTLPEMLRQMADQIEGDRDKGLGRG